MWPRRGPSWPGLVCPSLAWPASTRRFVNNKWNANFQLHQKIISASNRRSCCCCCCCCNFHCCCCRSWGSVDILNNCCALGTLHSAAAHCIAFGGNRSKTATQRSRCCCRRFSSSRGMIRISCTPLYLALSLLSRSLCSCLALCALLAVLAFFSLGLFTFRSVEFLQRLLELRRVKQSRFGFSFGFIADKAIGHKASGIHPSNHRLSTIALCVCCV